MIPPETNAKEPIEMTAAGGPPEQAQDEQEAPDLAALGHCPKPARLR